MDVGRLSELSEEYFSITGNGNVNPKLRKLIDTLLKPWYGAYENSELDEFYSLAGYVFTQCVEKYVPEQGKFEAYFASCLSNRIKDYFSMKNAERRMPQYTNNSGEKVYMPPISLDTPLNEDDEDTLLDLVADKTSTEQRVLSNSVSPVVDEYRKRLTKTQRKIVDLLLEGYQRSEIISEMGLSAKQYDREFMGLKTFEKSSVLRNKTRVSQVLESKRGATNVAKAQTSKTIHRSVSSIYDALKYKEMRLDYYLQRYAGQWDNVTRSNYISDLIQGNPIPEIVAAEEIIDGHAINWIIDGLQRISTAVMFKNNEFKIGKNVERPIVSYQRCVTENGKDKYITEECDIRGKSYSQLPGELQREFDNFEISGVLYINCSKEDIEYHLRRYNRCQPMNKAQKALTFMGEDFGIAIKEISKHDFFSNNLFTNNTRIKGNVEALVIDTLMLMFFSGDWKKASDANAMYLRDHLTEEQCEEFKEILDRLENIYTDDLKDFFGTKNGKYYINLFKEFMNLGLPDEKFRDFLVDLENELRFKEIDGVTLASLEETRNTKDKKVISERMDHLVALMKYAFNKEETDTKINVTDKAVKDYISRFKDQYIIQRMNASENTITEAALRTMYGLKKTEKELEEEANKYSVEATKEDDVMFGLDCLEDLSMSLDEHAEILSIQYIPSLITAILHGYIDLDEEKLTEEWFYDYSHKNNVSNDSLSVENLDRYIQEHKQCA